MSPLAHANVCSIKLTDKFNHDSQDQILLQSCNDPTTKLGAKQHIYICHINHAARCCCQILLPDAAARFYCQMLLPDSTGQMLLPDSRGRKAETLKFQQGSNHMLITHIPSNSSKNSWVVTAQPSRRPANST